MLKMLRSPAKPPPTAALTPNMSEHIFEACPRMPMPALTFMHSTTQRHQNCGVFHARSTPTLAVVIIGLRCSSRLPAFRLPIFWRNPDDECAEQHVDRIERGHGDKGL